MDLDDTPDQARYRTRARAWIAEHRHEAPPAVAGIGGSADIVERRRWQRLLAEAGLAGVMWPAEYGGAGLTMFIVPMHAGAVTVRPLRQISGDAHFNEVFFDGLEVRADAVLGGVGDGWGVATTTLMYERLMAMVAFDELLQGPEQLLAPIADHPGLDDARVRHAIAEVTTQRLGMRYALYRALTALERGSIPGPEAGLGKIDAVEASRQACALIAEVLGPDALEGPPEPRLDKGISFSELTRRSAPARG
ncbi:MAG: hypothetical protein E6J03_10500 [Chloroflexi bacterium]|nr:MAG: hypothetical protein E6J03_10500 [Chloroflexota bacterium]